MEALRIVIPEDLLLATGQSREEFVREAKLILAARLFEMSRLSSGKAAELCGLERKDFLRTVSRMGIPVVDLDEQELDQEFVDA